MATETMRLAKGRETGCIAKMLPAKTKAARALFPLRGSPGGVGRSRTTAVNANTTVNRTVTSNSRSITIGTFRQFS